MGELWLAWNLRRISVKRGLSQERLAYDAEVDRSYVGGLERREENPTVDVLDRLAATTAQPMMQDMNITPALTPQELARTRSKRGRVGGRLAQATERPGLSFEFHGWISGENL
jgi:transcriptional regulator with XRE-family HTH domain